ncbi:MAG TPA: class I SAM-dependent methyltransferase [Candidatus Melainabacteria bacterium]|nr:class I SAM-dependent methyltransferase [Candidatus Melainabacteria bacterium]
MFEPQQVVDLLNPAPGAHVLDLATHHGDTAIALANVGCIVTAIDSSQKALQKCNHVLQEKKISNVTTMLMDAENLTFEEAKFDGATCRMAMHHFDDVPEALRQIAKVLKENAPVIIGDAISPDNRALGDFLMKIGRLRDETFKTLFTVDDWKQLLHENGLRLVDHKLIKDTRDATKWLERSPLSDEQKERIHKAFNESSQETKDYLQAKIAEGKIVEFTDDKILIKAVKI